MNRLRKNLCVWGLLLLLVCPLRLSAQGQLQLYVDNVEVTPANASNVLVGMGPGKDGCVSYSFETHTLTLKDAKLTNRITVTAERPDQPITIHLEGKNEINTISSAIWVLSPVEVEGPGELQINTSNGVSGGCGFMLAGQQPELYLRIKNTTIRIESAKDGQAIFSPVMREGFVVIENSKFYSTGLIAGMKELYLNGCSIVNSDQVELGMEARSNGYSCAVMLVKGTKDYNYGPVQIDPDNSYPIAIGATVVTRQNAQDVLSQSGKKGTVRYDRETNTLHLNNLKLTELKENGIFTRFSPLDRPLTIQVTGNNVIESEYSGMLLFGNTTIKGSGSLVVNAKNSTADFAGILIADEDKLIIEDCELTATGTFGIAGIRKGSKLLVRNAALKVNCTNAIQGACIEGFRTFDIEKSVLKEPEGAHFSKNLGGITVDDISLCKDRLLFFRANALETISEVIPRIATSTGKLMLATTDPKTVVLYSLDGQVLRRAICQESLEWMLPSGQYLLAIGTFSTKLLIP